MTTIEKWRNPNRGIIQIRRYAPGTSDTKPVMIQGGQEFRVTPDERAMNQSLAKTPAQCPFRNGRLEYLGLADSIATPAPVPVQPGAPAPSIPVQPGPASPNGVADSIHDTPAAQPSTPAVASPTTLPEASTPVPESSEPVPNGGQAPQSSEPVAGTASVPADAPAAPQLSAEDIETILVGHHTSAYALLRKIAVPALAERVYAMSKDSARDVGQTRREKILERVKELNPAFVVTEPAMDPSLTSDGLPAPEDFDPDTGRRVGQAGPEAMPGLDEPTDPAAPPDPEHPLVMVDGVPTDGSIFMLPGSSIPEGLPAPSGLAPGEYADSVV